MTDEPVFVPKAVPKEPSIEELALTNSKPIKSEGAGSSPTKTSEEDAIDNDDVPF